VLEESTQAYYNMMKQIRDIFGPFAGYIQDIVKVVDPREEALKSQIEESNKLISESEAKERAYNKALEKGLTSKNDAAKAEEDRQKEIETAAKEKEQAAKKSQDEATRNAEATQKKLEATEEKRYQAGVKYSEALVDIARKSADDAKRLAQAARQKEVDNQRAFNQDMGDLSADFQASEREEAIARLEQEAADARAHALTLEGIRDEAFNNEKDLLRERDFLGASLVRENANKQIEQENQTFLDAQKEKMILQKQEDAQQLRELDKARRDRLTALQRANQEAQIQYARDVQNQREARRIAEREAMIARNKELKAASDTARALLGIQAQQQNAQLQMAQNTLNQLRGATSTTNNNNKTVNGGLNFNINAPAGGMNATQVQNQILSTLGSVGLA